MENTKLLTAPCGLDCFNCELYRNNLTDEIRNMFSVKLGVPPAEVECKGCREQKGERSGFPRCKTYDCANKMEVDFCFECEDFPCSKLQPALDGADRFPHNIKLFNLCRIKAVGLEEWSKEASGIRKRYFFGKFIIGQGPVDD